jgi:hypothetical protein
MFARLLLTFLLVCVASPAFADASVVVLGLRSVEGDDETANQLTEQLRDAAGSVRGWSVSSASVSMAQMSLAHGCEEVDVACLADIAAGLKMDLVVYGTLRRNSARENYDFALSLALYDAREGAIQKILDDIVPRGEPPEQMAARARKLMQRLSSTVVGGTISIQANTTNAEVKVNGQRVGQTRDGALRLGGLQPGSYRIEIVKDGYAAHVSTVTVGEGSETSIAAVLTPLGVGGSPDSDYTDYEPRSRGHRLGWLGWTLFGVSAASLVGMGVSMAIINDIDKNDQKRLYSAAVFNGNQVVLNDGDPSTDADAYDDVCEAARDGHDFNLGADVARDVASKCNTADTMEVLQYVFLGTAIAAASAGLALVLTAGSGKDEHARSSGPALSLHPRIGRNGGGVLASLRF